MSLSGIEFDTQAEGTNSSAISSLEGLGTHVSDAPYDAASRDEESAEEGGRDGLLDHVPCMLCMLPNRAFPR